MGKLTDYGIILMAELAADSGRLYKAVELAEMLQLPQPTVSKLLQRLATTGLLDAVRGVHGGYRLARASEEISVADMIRVLEGSSGITECVEHPGACSQEEVCSVRTKWPAINAAVWQALGQISLAELIQPDGLADHPVVWKTQMEISQEAS